MIDYGKILPSKIVDIPKSGIRRYFDMITPDMKDVISLTVGQPDFVTPWHIREAGIQSLETGKTFYTANAGLFELRQEINNYMTRRFDLSYEHTLKIGLVIALESRFSASYNEYLLGFVDHDLLTAFLSLLCIFTYFFNFSTTISISSTVLSQPKLNLTAPSMASGVSPCALSTWLPFLWDEHADPVETYIPSCSSI